jgi:hypothetical protein
LNGAPHQDRWRRYEAYVVTDKGERQEAYFHPVTLAPVPTKPR